MRLYLAVAVLMLAFVAYTEAEEESIDQKFARLSEQNLADNAENTDDKRTNCGDGPQNWFQEQLEKLASKYMTQ